MEAKIHNIHLNQEWINGFIEALFSQLDENIGPFLSSLYDYEIQCNKQENGLWKVVIPYAIISDSRADLNVYFELSENTKIEVFRLKVEQAVEEIIGRVRRFDQKTFANERNDE